ncbi:MAG: metallophosphoesterase [Sporomusaceae bacterium]|nr:metallophosphoesterase [Sporomusaceae bacterium]
MIGAIWMAVVYYGFLLTMLIDIARLLDRAIPFLPSVLKQQPHWAGLAAILLVGGVLAYGFWNARHPVINRYDIHIEKSGGHFKQVHAVVVSDIHLGNLIGANRLEQLVTTVNRLQPDVVLLPGDIIDAELKPFLDENMGPVLQRLQPPLGTYAVLGNHEYIGGETEGIIAALQEAGVTILRDDKAIIAGSLVIAGRDDRSRLNYGGSARSPLSAILAGVNPALPLILLDHQPLDLDESRQNRVDLQFSGHTHRGQLFPNQLITAAMFETDWGYLRQETFQLIVSCGYGTWGPPFRIGNRPELLDVYITFGH